MAEMNRRLGRIEGRFIDIVETFAKGDPSYPPLELRVRLLENSDAETRGALKLARWGVATAIGAAGVALAIAANLIG